MKNKKIFIQIASYRDPQLIPTLKDCISNAKYPENLVFSIAWQHGLEDSWDNLDEFKNDPRFKIIDIDYKNSDGACWARNILKQQYTNEEYTLQLDSHHRFIKNWDEELITMYKQLIDLGHEKPLITSYIPSYNPQNDPVERQQTPWKMNFDRFIPEGAIFFLPARQCNDPASHRPQPARALRQNSWRSPDWDQTLPQAFLISSVRRASVRSASARANTDLRAASPRRLRSSG